jgi:hypothetical protein
MALGKYSPFFPVASERAILMGRHCLEFFGIGVTDGQAVGHTAPHAHVNVIPRYAET